MTVLTDSAEVAAFCGRLRNNACIAVDTEFMRERTYWPLLCLVQLAGRDEAAAIDPLAPGIDLGPVFELMADGNVLKVFHAARQDLEIFHHLSGAVPHPVFDTQVAAMVCGFGDQVGYEAIVQRITGQRVDKNSRFTDWKHRPLSKRQIAYALADVTHLRTVHEGIAAMLEQNGRADWISEEMAVLASAETYLVDPREAWKRIRTKARGSRDLAILRELAAWRENTARGRNIPRNRVVSDEVLVQVSIRKPASVEELGAVRLVSKGLANGSYGRELLAAVARTRSLPDAELPAARHGHRDAAAPEALVDLLRTLLRARCESEGIAMRLVTSMADLERFALSDDPQHPLARGWRHELFGRDAGRLKRGELALTFEDGTLKLVEP